MRMAWAASAKPVPAGAGRTWMTRVSMRPRLISLVAAVTGAVSQGRALSCAFRPGWLPRTGHRKCAFLALRRKKALPLVVCIASAGTRTPSRGSGSSSGRKWVTSLALPDLATLSWAMTRPGTWVTAASRCTFLFPPALASLRSLPSTAAAGRAGTGPGSPGPGRSPPGRARVRANPAVAAFRAQPRRGRRLPLPFLPVFLLPALFFRTVRGRDRGIERGGGHALGQGSLELVGVQQFREPVQHRGGRRDPQPGPRADPAAVARQHVLVPARRGLRDRQRPVVRGRPARDQHRYQRGQRMPLPPPVPPVGQEAVQRLPQRHRIGRRASREVAADAVGKPR